MKTRIIAAAVLVPVLFLVVLAAPEIVAAVVLGVLLAIASYELLYRTGLVTHPRLVVYSSVMAFGISMWSYLDSIHAYFILMVMVYFMLLFAEMMMDHVKVHFEMVGMCFVSGVILPYLLSALVRILIMSFGRYVILIPFVVAFLSDAEAYFVGLKFGRHKLAPVVSPNKTIEGLLGGLAAAMVGMLIYTVILDWPLKLDVNYGLALLYGLIGSLVVTFGDLCFSIIKRQTGIKDYGNLIPGHGGALDRLDSLTLVAPLMEALLLIAPVIIVERGKRNGKICQYSWLYRLHRPAEPGYYPPPARSSGGGAYRRVQRGADGGAVPGISSGAGSDGHGGRGQGSGGGDCGPSHPGKLGGGRAD